MTVYEYIKKHGLRRFARWPGTDLPIDAVLIEPSNNDKFEI